MSLKPIASVQKTESILSSTQGQIEKARSILRQEAQAIQALAETLDDRFTKAVQKILNLSGRLVVTGMGKSGHIARKIAATFASTGQLAFFVHPGEASHGDLGMITPSDGVLALSNSGETSELGPLISHLRRFSIPLIGVTQNPDSTLAKVATVALILPTVPEACPMGLAPTTSTSMMMALGDALAIALMQHRGFDRTDFKVIHPGGTLGNQLKRVKDCMHKKSHLPLVSEDTLMQEVIVAMSSKGFGCCGVANKENHLVGIVTDGDIRRHMGDTFLTLPAQKVMTPHPVTIGPEGLMADALAIFNQKAITSLFVLQSESQPVPIGLIHIHDCLRLGAM